MSMPQIDGLTFDEEKFAVHGITPRQVDQILDDAYFIAPNRRGRRGTHLIIGRDHGGACIAVPIERTRDPVCWRPITAWPCKDHERARLDDIDERGL